jgi:hypothetical protein
MASSEGQGRTWSRNFSTEAMAQSGEGLEGDAFCTSEGVPFTLEELNGLDGELLSIICTRSLAAHWPTSTYDTKPWEISFSLIDYVLMYLVAPYQSRFDTLSEQSHAMYAFKLIDFGLLIK